MRSDWSDGLRQQQQREEVKDQGAYGEKISPSDEENAVASSLGRPSAWALRISTASSWAILGKDTNLSSYSRVESTGDGLAVVSHKGGGRCGGGEVIRHREGLPSKSEAT
eukprot:4875745-Pleurochrysis_carterae.AAC.5